MARGWAGTSSRKNQDCASWAIGLLAIVGAGLIVGTIFAAITVLPSSPSHSATITTTNHYELLPSTSPPTKTTTSTTSSATTTTSTSITTTVATSTPSTATGTTSSETQLAITSTTRTVAFTTTTTTSKTLPATTATTSTEVEITASTSNSILGESTTADELMLLICPAGQARRFGTCHRCPAGQKPNWQQDNCEDCGEGTAGTDGTCLRCPPGRTSGADHTECFRCPHGKAGRTGLCETCVEGSVPDRDHIHCRESQEKVLLWLLAVFPLLVGGSTGLIQLTMGTPPWWVKIYHHLFHKKTPTEQPGCFLVWYDKCQACSKYKFRYEFNLKGHQSGMKCKECTGDIDKAGQSPSELWQDLRNAQHAIQAFQGNGGNRRVLPAEEASAPQPQLLLPVSAPQAPASQLNWPLDESPRACDTKQSQPSHQDSDTLS